MVTSSFSMLIFVVIECLWGIAWLVLLRRIDISPFHFDRAIVCGCLGSSFGNCRRVVGLWTFLFPVFASRPLRGGRCCARRWRYFDGSGFPSSIIRVLYPLCGIFVDKESFASFRYTGQKIVFLVIQFFEIRFHVWQILMISRWLSPRNHGESGFFFDWQRLYLTCFLWYAARCARSYPCV